MTDWNLDSQLRALRSDFEQQTRETERKLSSQLREIEWKLSAQARETESSIRQLQSQRGWGSEWLPLCIPILFYWTVIIMIIVDSAHTGH